MQRGPAGLVAFPRLAAQTRRARNDEQAHSFAASLRTKRYDRSKAVESRNFRGCETRSPRASAGLFRLSWRLKSWRLCSCESRLAPTPCQRSCTLLLFVQSRLSNQVSSSLHLRRCTLQCVILVTLGIESYDVFGIAHHTISPQTRLLPPPAPTTPPDNLSLDLTPAQALLHRISATPHCRVRHAERATAMNALTSTRRHASALIAKGGGQRGKWRCSRMVCVDA